jgi:hypothetical protein
MFSGRCFRSRVLKYLFFSLTLFVAFAASAHAQAINTIPGWDGNQYISSFGVTDTATYGETITVAAGATSLNSFSFEIGNCSANVTFRGSVYAWDGTKATGPSLFTSPVMTVNSGSTYQLVTFNTGGVSLPAGTYVLFASTSQDQTGAPNSSCRWGSVGNNTAYAGGQFVFLNNGPNPGQWTTSTWSNINQDLAFQVNGLTTAPQATGVPAASTTSLLIGLVGLTAVGLYQLSRSRVKNAA